MNQYSLVPAQLQELWEGRKEIRPTALGATVWTSFQGLLPLPLTFTHKAVGLFTYS
jgi:hypothetical protein